MGLLPENVCVPVPALIILIAVAAPLLVVKILRKRAAAVVHADSQGIGIVLTFVHRAGACQRIDARTGIPKCERRTRGNVQRRLIVCPHAGAVFVSQQSALNVDRGWCFRRG